MSNIGYAKFTVGDSYYVYDTTTNAIVRMPRAAWHMLEDYLQSGAAHAIRSHRNRFAPEQLQAGVRFLDTARTDRGMFQPFVQKDFRSLASREHVERAVSSHLGALGLNMTDACNQRCTYCVYSGAYSGERTHGSERMSWDVAKRCIDYYFAHASDEKSETITFYGGEPLLNWDVLSKCVEYVRETLQKRGCQLRIATNLTLLNDARLKFLIGYDVGLQVSIDGPVEVHDRARRFPDGRGTHTKVMSKLALIRETDAAYFKDFVSLACTIDKHDDPGTIVEYFTEDELLRELPVAFGALRESDIDGITVAPEVRDIHKDRLDRILAGYAREMALPHSPAYHKTMHNLLWSVFGQLAERRQSRCSAVVTPNTTCIPGAAHLFAASDGKLYTCEKFSILEYEIGHVDSGIDVDEALSLLGTYVAYCEDLCQECWAYRLCSQCFVHSIAGDRISKEQKKRSCEHTRRETLHALERFVYLWENEPEGVRGEPFSLHAAVRAARRIE